VNKIFKNKNIEFFVDDNGDIWASLKGICDCIGVKNSYENWQRKNKIPNEWKGVYQKITIIKEPAIYKIIMHSDNLEATQFQNWVCEEVLPSLRKNGEYKIQQELELTKSKLMQKEIELQEKEKLARIELNNREKIIQDQIQYIRKLYPIRDEKNYIYIQTCKAYASQGYFKIGITNNPKARNSNYNVGAPQTEEFKMYQVYLREVINAPLVEKILKDLLRTFKHDNEKKEFVRIPLYILKEVGDIIVNGIENSCKILNDFMTNISISESLEWDKEIYQTIKEKCLPSQNYSVINYEISLRANDEGIECNISQKNNDSYETYIRDIPKNKLINTRTPPMTKLKEEIIHLSRSSSLKFLIAMKKEHEIQKEIIPNINTISYGLVPASTFYQMFINWCKDNGEAVVSNSKFGLNIKNFITKKKTKYRTEYNLSTINII
jgi:prophage antirepressor-like protein